MGSLLGLVFWLSPAAVSGVEPLDLKPDLRQVSLTPHIEVFEDPTGELGVEEVRRNVFEGAGRLAGMGHTDSAVWIRFALHNPSRDSFAAMLEVGYPQLDEVVLFVPTGSGDYAVTRLGDAQPYPQRILKLRHFVFPLSVAAQTTQICYLRVVSTSVLAVPLRLSSARLYYEHLQSSTLFLGIFYGIVLGLLAYNLFLFLSTREVSYLYYVGASFFWGLYFAQIDGFAYPLWPTAQEWQQYSVFIFANAGIICNLQFTRHYLDTIGQSRWLDRVFQAYLAATLLNLIVTPFVELTFLERSVGIISTAVFVSIFAAIVRLRAGFKPAALYLVGWTGYLILALLSNLTAQGLLPYFLLAVFGVKIGLLFERVFSSLGLAGRLKALQDHELELRCDALEARAQTQAEAAERLRVEGVLQEREEQLLQAQKLEAVGLLAGGVAHDFNNLLTVIRGYNQIFLDKLETKNPLYEVSEQISHTTEKAASLTRQLLAFSRPELARPRVVDLNEAVKKAESMLGRLIGEDIKLVVDVGCAASRVKVDPGQLEQVIANVVVNARDAMPKGGAITLATRCLELGPEEMAGDDSMSPGPYVGLSVTDTGCGMDAETQARVFEPFFTTKDKGHGTGLGLSTVYGIVRQNGGRVGLQSEPGQGTKFEIQLPLCHDEAESMDVKPVSGDPESLRGTETILLVEDEAIIREIVLARLTPMGYQVLTAADGLEALQVAQDWGRAIHLLLTDVVMPELSGPELCQRLRQRHPDVKVVFMSAYSGDRLEALPPHDGYIEKPFHLPELPGQIRDILDSCSDQEAAGPDGNGAMAPHRDEAPRRVRGPGTPSS